MTQKQKKEKKRLKNFFFFWEGGNPPQLFPQCGIGAKSAGIPQMRCLAPTLGSWHIKIVLKCNWLFRQISRLMECTVALTHKITNPIIIFRDAGDGNTSIMLQIFMMVTFFSLLPILYIFQRHSSPINRVRPAEKQARNIGIWVLW